MELNEVKIIKVGNQEFHLFRTNRAYIEFEKLAGISPYDIESREHILKLFYCFAKAGASKSGLTFKFTWDQFLDKIDDFPEESLINFSGAFIGTVDNKKK